jgi:hypothetical protein
MNHMQHDGMQSTGLLEPRRQQLQSAAPVEELSAENADSVVDLDALDFKTTDELEPLDEIIGQSRRPWR